MTTPTTTPRLDRNVAMILAMILAILVLSYWSVFVRLSEIWSRNPDYSHGYLVPLFSGYLLYRYREEWLPLISEPKPLWSVALGVGLILLALTLRMTGILGRLLSVEGISFPIMLAGLMCIAGGVRAVYINAAAITFFCFMLMIPNQVDLMLRGKLQEAATLGSVFTLQTIGVPTMNQGNVLTLPHAEVGVVEACSGIRILASLGAIAFAVCVLLEPSWIHRGLILASVLPIALFVNITRVVITALGHEYYPEQSERIHDAAGWLMILMSVLLLVLCQRYFAALFPVEDTDAPTPSRLDGRGRLAKA